MSEAAVAGTSPRVVIPSARPRSTLRRPLRAEVIEGADAYEALSPDWRRLADMQPGAILFQSPELLAAWARHFAPGHKFATVVVRDGSRPVLIWPLMIERRMLFRVARCAGAPIGQYDEILLDPEADRDAAIGAALRVLREAARPDLVLLERVRSDSALSQTLRGVAPLFADEAAPYADLSRGKDAMLASLKGEVFRRQRKRMRRFEKEGETSFRIAGNSSEAQRWLVEALALKRDWLMSSGRISRAFVRQETGDCLIDIARTLAAPDASPRLIVSRLELHGRAAAIEAGFRHRGVYYLYLRAFAPEFAKLGPGNVLTEKMFAWCAENGIDRYDMLAPRSRNKREWQSNEVPVLDFALPMTPRGRFYSEAVLKRIAPALRDAFYALPSRFRSKLAGLALKV